MHADQRLQPAVGEKCRLVAAAVVGLVYFAVLAALPRHVFWSPDEGVKFIQMRAIQWTDGLAYSLPYPSERLERELGSRPSRCVESGFYPTASEGGPVRFHWPMWFPLLSRPFFETLGVDGIYLIPLLSGLLTAMLAGRLYAEFAPPGGAAAILLVGFGTPVFFYALCFWEHTLATLFGMAAIALLVLAPPGRAATLLFIAPLLTVAAMLRMEMLALAAACAVSWVACRVAAGRRPAPAAHAPQALRAGHSPWRWRVLALLSLTALALLLLFVPSALAPRHQRTLAVLPQILGAAIQRLPTLADGLVSVYVNGPTGDGPAVKRIWEAVAFLAAGICFIAPLYRPRRLESLLLLSSMSVLLAFSVSVLVSDQGYGALHGVIPLAPFVVVAGYACQAAWRRRDYRLWALATAALSYMFIAFLLMFARAPVPLAGLEWGPRYFLALYPMMAVLALLAIRNSYPGDRRQAPRLAFRGLLIAMMLVAVAYEVRGVAMLYRRRTEIAAWSDVLRDAGPVVTDVWWLPAALAPIFVSEEMYCLPSRRDWSEWLAAAPAYDATTFTFASLAPIEIETLPALGARASLQASENVAGMYFARVRLARRTEPPALPAR